MCAKRKQGFKVRIWLSGRNWLGAQRPKAYREGERVVGVDGSSLLVVEVVSDVDDVGTAAVPTDFHVRGEAVRVDQRPVRGCSLVLRSREHVTAHVIGAGMPCFGFRAPHLRPRLYMELFLYMLMMLKR